MPIREHDPQTAVNNLFGTLGPLCPACSGLGRTLRFSHGGATRYATKCVCGGTGVDRELVREREMSLLLTRLYDLESQALTNAQLLKDIQSRFPTNGKMSRQYWVELIAWATASGTAVGNTGTETILFPNITIPANYVQDGRNLWLKLSGQHSTKGSGTVTVQFFIRWGGVSGTLITKTGVITQVVSLTAALWEIDVLLSQRSNGSSGTVMGNGNATVYGATAPTIGSATGAPAVSPFTNGGQVTPAVATCDFTADTALAVSIQHGAADSANTATGLQYILESKN